MQVLCEITHYCIFYRQLSPPLCCEREGVFTNKQYRLGCSISIKMDSQPCGGTIANTVRVFTATSLVNVKCGDIDVVMIHSVDSCYIVGETLSMNLLPDLCIIYKSLAMFRFQFETLKTKYKIKIINNN